MKNTGFQQESWSRLGQDPVKTWSKLGRELRGTRERHGRGLVGTDKIPGSDCMMKFLECKERKNVNDLKESVFQQEG